MGPVCNLIGISVPCAEHSWQEAWKARLYEFVPQILSQTLHFTHLPIYLTETPGSMGMRSAWIGEDSSRLHSHQPCEQAHFHPSLPHSVLANISTFVSLITREQPCILV